MTSKATFFLIFFGLLFQHATAQTVRIDSIRIQGNDRTKDWVIERELLFKTATVYDSTEFAENLVRSENRLLNLNLFLRVEIRLAENDEATILLVDVLEKWYIWPIPFIEFSDRNFNVWQNLEFSPDRTNYGLYLFNYNLFGRNHSLKASFINGYYDRYALLYRIPFFNATSKWGMEIETYYDKQDELWLDTEEDKLQFFMSEDSSYIKSFTTDLRFNYQHELFRNSVVNLTFGRKIISEDARLQSPYLFGNQRSQNRIDVGYTYIEDFRDNRFFPMKGAYASVGLSYSRYLSEASHASRNNVAFELTTQRFDQINDRWYSSYGFYGKINSNESLPYADNRMLGYKQTVRGFEPYVIDGYAGFHVSSELKFKAYENREINVDFVPYLRYQKLPYKLVISYFVDAGGAFMPYLNGQNNLPNTVLSSTGISVQNLFYNDRVLRFDVTLNSLAQTGFFVHFTKAI